MKQQRCRTPYGDQAAAALDTFSHVYDNPVRPDSIEENIKALDLGPDYYGSARFTSRLDAVSCPRHDLLNRRIQSTFADGAVASFTYDAGGRLIQADDTADPHRPITLGYDSLDRLLAETTALGTVSYQYDALGRRTQMIVWNVKRY